MVKDCLLHQTAFVVNITTYGFRFANLRDMRLIQPEAKVINGNARHDSRALCQTGTFCENL